MRSIQSTDRTDRHNKGRENDHNPPLEEGKLFHLSRPWQFVHRSIWHLWRNRNYLSIRKLINIALVNLEYLLHREHPIGMPYDIKLEPTNICNSACKLCPTGMGLNGRAKGKMSFERFREIIDQIKSYTYVLDLSNWGDPLIVPDIYKMIRYAHDQKIWTYISTNLHAFSIENNNAEKLMDSGLDMLNCSVHAVTQEVFESYQPGKQLQPVLDKIRTIQEAKRKRGVSKPDLRMFFTVTRYNEHEIDKFYALAEEMGCTPVITHASLNLRFLGKDKDLRELPVSAAETDALEQQTRKEWLPENPRWVAPWYQDNSWLEKSEKGKRKSLRCSWPWRNSVINWNGDVTICCGVFDPKYVLGNVFETTFKSIWKNDNYRLARRTFKREVGESEGQPCRNCPGVLS